MYSPPNSVDFLGAFLLFLGLWKICDLIEWNDERKRKARDLKAQRDSLEGFKCVVDSPPFSAKK